MVEKPIGIYSVPRKLDLATLFVLTASYGVLFALMNVFQFSALVFATIAGFFTSVAISQALLFGGKSPRAASCVTGAVYFVLTMLPTMDSYSELALVVLLLAIFGLSIGYFAGAFIGGVFLVIDRLRADRRKFYAAATFHSKGQIEDEF